MIEAFYMNCLGVSRVNLLADSNIGSFKDADSVTNISRLKHTTCVEKIQQYQRELLHKLTKMFDLFIQLF